MYCFWGLPRWVGVLQAQHFFRSCRLILQITFHVPKSFKGKISEMFRLKFLSFPFHYLKSAYLCSRIKRSFWTSHKKDILYWNKPFLPFTISTHIFKLFHTSLILYNFFLKQLRQIRIQEAINNLRVR